MASLTPAEHSAVVELRRDLFPGLVHQLETTDAPVTPDLETSARYYLREKYQILDDDKLNICVQHVSSWLLRLVPINRR